MSFRKAEKKTVQPPRQIINECTVQLNRYGDITSADSEGTGNRVKPVEGLNLKSKELRKVKHFLERAAAASGNGDIDKKE